MMRKKSCQEVRIDLFPFLKGEMGTGEDQGIQQHLEECPVCAEELGEIRIVLKAIQEYVPLLDTDPGTWERLQSRIRSSRCDSARRHKVEIRIASGLIAIFGGICLLWLLRINDQVLGALKETLSYLGINLPWLTQGPLSSFVSPLLFIALCSSMTLILSPLLLRRKKADQEDVHPLREGKAYEWKGS